jgi:Spy/CpxP family protein refolding chaperone
MKNLILVMSVLFAIAVLNPQIYSQKKDHSKSREFRINLKEQLNLSEDQEKKIEALKLSHEESMIKFRADIELKELEMRKLKSSDKFSRSAMINLTKEISAIKNDLALSITNHQMDVYDLLDESQRKVWLEKQEQFGHMKHKMKNKMQERRNW